MTREEIQALKAAFVKVALYYRDTVPDETIKLYAADLEDLPLPAVLDAMQRYRRDPKSRRTPLPAELRALLETPITPQETAREAAVRLVAAVGRHGYAWESGYVSVGGARRWDGGDASHDSFQAALIAEAGELAPDIVRTCGGWAAFHGLVNEAEPTIMHAQLRDLAASLAKRRANQPRIAGTERAALAPSTQALVSGLADRMGS